MAKAVLFSSAVEALGDIGDGLASEVWWTPNHPFSSSLTGETSKQLSDEYEASTGKQWTQFVGFVHALFEVCFDVVSRAGSTDKQAIADAAAATTLDTIVGPIAYGKTASPEERQPDLARRRSVAEAERRQVPVRAVRRQQQAVAGDPDQRRPRSRWPDIAHPWRHCCEVVDLSQALRRARRWCEDFSFDVAEGEALGIVGPNGAGKTTLLNLIAGDLRADKGTVSLGGHDMTKLPAHVRCHRGIGRTAQIPRPFEG